MSGRYRTLVVDPPWATKTGPMSAGGMGEGFIGGETASQPLSYPTMRVEEMAFIPVSSLAEKDAHLYLWTTNGFLEAAFKLVRLWDFNHSTTLVWAKNPMGGGLGSDAFGISTEFLLFCRRGSLPARERFNTTWFNWKRRYDKRGKPQHSAKPIGALELIERVSHPPFCELFSREEEPRVGWSYHGDESLQTVELTP